MHPLVIEVPIANRGVELSNLWTGLTAVGLLASLGAGIVRGFSGFGFSALTVAGISLFMAPAAVVPAVLVLEILASISVWRSAVRDLDISCAPAVAYRRPQAYCRDFSMDWQPAEA